MALQILQEVVLQLFILSKYPFLKIFIWLQHVESLIEACGIQFLDQRLNPGPLHWKHEALATGPSGKSPERICFNLFIFYWDIPDSSVGKESTSNVGDLGSIPGLGRSPGEGKGYPLQYSGLENLMDCIVHGVAKSQTQLIDSLHFTSQPINNAVIVSGEQ